MGTSADQVVNLIALEGGRLTQCALGGNQQKQLELGECTQLMEGGPRPDLVRGEPRAGEPLTIDVDATHLEPGIPCLGLAGGGAIWVYSDAGGCWVELRELHIRVLASLWHRSGIADTAHRADLTPEDVKEALPELSLIGAVRIIHHEDRSRVPPSLSNGRPHPPSVPEPLGDASTLRASPPDGDREADTAPREPQRPRRIPVFSFWATDSGPHLGSAAVVAYARVHDDRLLTSTFDLRRALPAEQVLEEIARLEGPAVLLCSNYIWSVEANLDVARRALATNPHVVVIHGGPSTPRYPADGERFLQGLEGDHILVNGEGELTFAELLEKIASETPDGASTLTLSRLHEVEGIQFVDRSSNSVVRTGARERHSELGDFPSALLSGELDLVEPEILRRVPISIETNRGCPYSCTFCDWGQNTMSRIRKFPLQRVEDELDWLVAHSIEQWILADANFGILRRDLEIAEMVAAKRRETGLPTWILVAPPKNATPRFVEIIDMLLEAGLSMKAALALQTRDAETLETIRRSNIGTSSYDRLAAELQKRGLPLASDIMVGLPGSTMDSFLNDLQWSIDHEVRAYLWPTFVLPNSPMNDPIYRRDHQISTKRSLVVRTATYTEHERALMDRYSYAYQAFEVLGVMRHVLRFLQWDHGMTATDVLRDVTDAADAHPDRYPLTNWLLNHFDVFLTAPVGWHPLFEELHRLVVDELGVPDRTDLQSVLAVNEFVMPAAGRKLPATLSVTHDYATYLRSARSEKFSDGPSRPERPLLSFGAGTIEAMADPDDLCTSGLRRLTESRGPAGFIGDFSVVAHLELLTSVTTYRPFTAEFVTQARDRGPRCTDPADAPTPA